MLLGLAIILLYLNILRISINEYYPVLHRVVSKTNNSCFGILFIFSVDYNLLYKTNSCICKTNLSIFLSFMFPYRTCLGKVRIQLSCQTFLILSFSNFWYKAPVTEPSCKQATHDFTRTALHCICQPFVSMHSTII